MAKVENKRTNPILWTLFAIIIPLIIVLIITGVILGLVGFNVVDWAKEKGGEIPVISNPITTEEEQDALEQIDRMTEILQEKDEEIIRLNNEIAELEYNLTELEDEVLRQEQVIDSIEALEDIETSGETNNSIIEVAKAYEEMKSKNAAAILQLMGQDEVLLILQEMPNEVRGDILQAMDAEVAAELTTLLMDD